MKVKNLLLGIKYQLPLARIVKNILSGNIVGILYKSSHQNKSGTLKIGYSTYEKALKASAAMEKKTGNLFSAYKCLYCNGFHIGKKFIAR